MPNTALDMIFVYGNEKFKTLLRTTANNNGIYAIL